MKLLLIGGTAFLGRHLVQAALARGHAVTLFNRGRTNPDLFPQVEKLHGDRATDLSSLRGRDWDAVIDTCGYVPSIVKRSAELLSNAVECYAFISTISAYTDARTIGMDESYPLGAMDVDAAYAITSNDGVTGETYGPLKALCEGEVARAMNGKGHALIIRPGLIVGPHDPTDRFTYWVRRVAQGGEMLVPDTPDQVWQVIDARDLAEWMIRMIEEGRDGAYNATGPDYPLTFGQILGICKRVSGSDAQFEWVSQQFVADEEIAGWEHLPLWLPSDNPDFAGFYNVNCRKAMDAGLTFRPIEDTIRDIWLWDQARDAELKTGLKREHEAALLAKWKDQS